MSSRILKSEDARPNGFWTIEVHKPALARIGFPDTTGANRQPVGLGEKETLDQARLKSENLLAKARLESENLLAKARLESEAIIGRGEAVRSEIEKEAYELGFQEGHAEALKRAEEESGLIRAQAGEVLAEAIRIRDEIIASSERDLVELAVEVARQVVHQQLRVEPDTILSIATAALQRLGSREQMVIHVNPQDLELVRSQRENLLQQIGEGASLHFAGDPSITGGGCRIESRGEKVEASVDGQLYRIKQALTGLLSEDSSGKR